MQQSPGQAPQEVNNEKVPDLLPVLLALRKYRKQIVQASPPSLPELINQHHIPSLPESHRLQPVPPNWAKDMLQRGKALVMLDGFDEVPLSERPAVAKWIHQQMQQYAKSVFVVTSRPKAYKEQDAAERLTLSMPMWVQPFDKAQRRRFAENWYLCQEQLKARRDTPEVRKVAAEGAGELLVQIEAEEELRKMAKNPLMLNMIATFHRQNSMAPLPKRQSELYGEICTLQLKDRPRARGLETLLLDMEPQLVLGKVALGMMQKILKRVERDELLEEINRALKEQDESVEAEAFLNDVVLISEIVVRQEDEYEFAHLSFQEYLAATYMAAKPEREALLYEHLQEDFWKPTILLYAGLVNPTKLIREAMNRKEFTLAYNCIQETRKQIDVVKAEFNHMTRSGSKSLHTKVLSEVAEEVNDARYADLERYLKNGQWKEADEETYRLMITEVGKEEGQWFDPDELRSFPCEPLKVIDGLWVEHSSGKFGFSAQKKMYLYDCGGVADGQYHKEAWEKYAQMNGWRMDIKYDLSSPQGHLPSMGITGGVIGNELFSVVSGLCSLLSHANL